MGERTSWRTALAPLIALGLHLAGVWLLLGVAPSPVRDSRSVAEAEELPIELMDPTASPRELPLPNAVRPSDLAPRPIERSRAIGAARASREPPVPESGGSTSTSASDPESHTSGPTAESSVPGPSFVPGPAVPDIGIGGTNRFLPRSEREVEAAASAQAHSDLLRHSGWDRDRSLGLGPEGPVLTALAEGTSQSVAPVRGRATFVATTNADGEVVSLELEEAEGGRPGWADARRLALAGLAGKKLRVPTSAKRVRMKIEVTSAWKLPSGQDPGTNVSVLHVPVSKGEGKDSPTMTILDPIPKIAMTYLELGPGISIPVPTVRIRIFETNADPSNIGAKARRVIHTHLVDSSVW